MPLKYEYSIKTFATLTTFKRELLIASQYIIEIKRYCNYYYERKITKML